MTIPLDPRDPVIAEWLRDHADRRRVDAARAVQQAEAVLAALAEAKRERLRQLAADHREQLRAEREARAAVNRRCREGLRRSAARRRGN